ncbi:MULTISPECIES: SRPBCC family protein [Amycolatopsis]|uniref:Polyketide cyclase / dehydrase and lipid transport n=2 Tax=Amycolatopsis TaxID=1813 RepID=A0A1I3XV38_9PSEU|nr:SRPBCC family protein [Amycolatopsis sacchari]SFK22921.1 Polyketide cyclase / dehydrase and lipid transport [Amycolatopsis sacchari]
MSDLVFSVDVAAPAGTTWLALTDWTRQGEWMLGTDVRVVSGDGRSVGSRLAAFTGVKGIGFTDLMEITTWEPPLRCTVRHLGSVVRGSGAFHVQPRGPQSSTCVWTESLDIPFGLLGRLGWPVVRPAFGIGVHRSLKRFAEFAADYTMGVP